MENAFTFNGKKYRLTSRGQKVQRLLGLLSACIGGGFFGYILVNAFFG